jgi:hypothetical protein
VHRDEKNDGAWDDYAGAVTDDLFGLSPAAAKVFLRILDRVVKLDRIRLPPELVHARRGLMRVSGDGIYGHGSQAGSGHADMASDDRTEALESWISTAEVAERLGLTQRHCARRAAALEDFGLAQLVKNRWWIHRDQVEAMETERQESA